MRKLSSFVLIVCIILPLSGCNTIPKDAFQLTETSLQDRQLQTRKFKTNDEIGLLAAGIGVLQDMGYTLEATEKSVGLITASKMTSAVDAAQVTLAILAAAMGGGSTPIDDKQKIRVTFVTHASQNEKGYFLARITFQRIVWRTNGTVSKATTIKDLELYEGFYEKLSKSVFLEAHKI